jgi:DNA polymerase-3 subunit gamma/tau
MGTVPNTVFERLLEWVGENNSAAVMTEIDTLLNAGNSPSQLARQMVRYLRNALMAKLGGESTELLQISEDERARVARTALLFSEEDLARFLQIMLRSFDELNYRQEPRFHLELGLLKLVHTQRLIPLEQLMSQLPGHQLSSGGGNVSRAAAPQARPAPGASQAASASSRPSTSPAAPPRSVASGEAARGGSVTSSTPPQPTFSPFESDTRRKSDPSGSATSDAPASPGQLEAGSVAVETAVALDEPPASSAMEEPENLQHEPPDPQIRGHVSPEAERIAADLEEEIASDDLPEPPASDEYVSIADKLREAVTQALHDKGHETASALLRAGQWSLSDPNTITVTVAVRKTMLSLTMNPEAERIARAALQQAGSSAKLVVLPGDGSASPAPPAAPAAKGSMQSHALDNPLVKQAQDLFRAEVRSVLDLRGKP